MAPVIIVLERSPPSLHPPHLPHLPPQRRSPVRVENTRRGKENLSSGQQAPLKPHSVPARDPLLRAFLPSGESHKGRLDVRQLLLGSWVEVWVEGERW